MNETQIMVSIIMPVYNHEEYLEKSIESVAMQRVNFKIELLIGEDCSSDSSRKICNQYEKKYDFIKVFYRDHNMGGRENSYDLKCHSVGKYLIHLEGDDYWTDCNKLQKQVDFLENNMEYIAVAHRFHVVDRYGQIYEDHDFECQFLQDNPYTVDKLEKGLMLSHVNTILLRNIFLNKNVDTNFWNESWHMAADYTLNALLVLNGLFYCMPEYMSCYRKVIDKDSSSFSALQKRHNTRDKMYRSIVNVERELNKTHNIQCSGRKKAIFASAVFAWFHCKNLKNWKVVKNIIIMSNQRVKYVYWFFYLVFSRIKLDFLGQKTQRIKF
jgi:glycosyltransferase involved in cell wall biosynthesis